MKDALSGTGIDFEEIELSGQLKLLESIKKTTGRTTVPQVAASRWAHSANAQMTRNHATTAAGAYVRHQPTVQPMTEFMVLRIPANGRGLVRSDAVADADPHTWSDAALAVVMC